MKFEPNLANATFSGDETIHVRLQRPASSIVLNSAEIEFKEVTMTAGGSRQSAIVSSNEKNETATFTVRNFIPSGPVDIHIRYTSVLNDKIRGF